MADKTYKMTVGLSNGTTLDAGTFVAPQGPAGESGGLNNWAHYNRGSTTFSNNSTYLVRATNESNLPENMTALLSTDSNGNGVFSFPIVGVDTDYKYYEIRTFYVGYSNSTGAGKINKCSLVSIEGTGAPQYSEETITSYEFYYIKLK